MKIAVVGATGLVGTVMLKVLEERNFPLTELIPVASEKSVGKEITFKGKKFAVVTIDTAIGMKPDIALFSAGGETSLLHAPRFAEAGTTVIDNSSAWRMDPSKKLVVPEVNAHELSIDDKIIANPNCSTIQMVVALAPLHREARVRRIIVSTYQAASGKGQAAVTDLKEQAARMLRGEPAAPSVFPGTLAFNVLCDWKAGADDYSEEEWKMVNETRKIMQDDTIGVSPTTVRVPVVHGHAESVYVEFERPLTPARAKELLAHAPGIVLLGDAYAPGNNPQPLLAEGRDEVFVGRIRADLAMPGALNLFVVADNLRKGAATNAVQIAELL